MLEGHKHSVYSTSVPFPPPPQNGSRRGSDDKWCRWEGVGNLLCPGALNKRLLPFYGLRDLGGKKKEKGQERGKGQKWKSTESKWREVPQSRPQ